MLLLPVVGLEVFEVSLEVFPIIFLISGLSFFLQVIWHHSSKFCIKFFALGVPVTIEALETLLLWGPPS